MVTCLGDALFPDVGVATVGLLRRLGVAVDFPRAQTCCGQPHFNSGFHDEARLLARHALETFAAAPPHFTGGFQDGPRLPPRHAIETFAAAPLVVTPSGSCAAMVKLEFAEL